MSKHKYGIYYGYWAESRYPDLAALAPRAAEIGFDILEISANSLMNVSPGARDEIAGAASDAGIEYAFVGALPRECDISCGDESKSRDGIRYLKELCRVVKEMGGSSVSGIFYGSMNAAPEPGKSRQYYLEESVRCMKEVIKAAEDLKMTINLEVLNRFSQFILNTALQAAEYVEMVGSPSLRIHLDTFHMNIEEANIASAIGAVAGRIGHFHISDNHRGLPGTGHIDFAAVAVALRDAGYTGPLVIESFLRAGYEFSQAFSVWRDLEHADMDEALRRSLAYVKALF
jgi:D-psicose/D-tagatose/L-ribulose 3-epimerase